jgi:hypothetical protein
MVYLAAQARGPATAVIAVTGTGRVWIDGDDVGAAPGDFKVAPGMHVVWLTGTERETRGLRVEDVKAGTPFEAKIDDATVSPRTQLQRARAAFAQASDAAARSSAMRRLAELTAVGDAVLLSSSNGKLIIQYWQDRAPGFSALKQVTDETPLELLSPLAPPKPAKERELPIVVPPLQTVHWYQQFTRHPVWTTAVGIAVLGAIAGGIAISRSGNSTFTWADTNGRFPSPTIGRP